MKQVFLTGATGAIGSALAPLYLEEPDTRLKLLLRAKRGHAVSERLQELGRFWGWHDDDSRWSRVQAVEGDAALPRFGISESDYAELSVTTTHIVHCAGAVKMTLPLEEARAHAVVPARAAIELAERNRGAGVLEKVEIVSTVGVGGRTPGLIPEKPMPEVTRFHNTYEAAKAEAEKVVFQHWKELPITVHRPSMVVGESRSGRIIHFQVFYHLCEFLSGRRTWGLMPALGGATLDIVPVDYVARGVHWSTGTHATAAKVLHLCSGPEDAVPLTALVRRIRSDMAASGEKAPAVRFLPLRLFKAGVPLLGLAASGAAKRALANLDLFLAYLDERQSFANSTSKPMLAAAGIGLPAPDTYLDNVFRYYRERSPESAATESGALPTPNLPT